MRLHNLGGVGLLLGAEKLHCVSQPYSGSSLCFGRRYSELYGRTCIANTSDTDTASVAAACQHACPLTHMPVSSLCSTQVSAALAFRQGNAFSKEKERGFLGLYNYSVFFMRTFLATVRGCTGFVGFNCSFLSESVFSIISKVWK